MAEFLDANFDDFFKTYHAKLVMSANYVTKRQSIKLLGELLLERSYYKIMTRYVANPEHLKLVMGLLRQPAGMIKFETFHVFKVSQFWDDLRRYSHGTDLCSQPGQISRSSEDSDSQPGQAAELLDNVL